MEAGAEGDWRAGIAAWCIDERGRVWSRGESQQPIASGLSEGDVISISVDQHACRASFYRSRSRLPLFVCDHRSFNPSFTAWAWHVPPDFRI